MKHSPVIRASKMLFMVQCVLCKSKSLQTEALPLGRSA